MPTNKLLPISRQPEQRSTERVIREGLVKLAEVFRKDRAPYPLTPVLTQIWIDALDDLEPGRCEAAFSKLVRVGCRREFPTPADVRAQLDQADSKGLELEAANAWQKLLTWIERYYHPDIGVTPGAPELSGPVEHACRAAGGFRWIERCGEDDLVWARKTFLAAYTNVHETGEVKHLLSRNEARRAFFQITNPPRKQLAAAKPTEAPEPTEKPKPAEVRSVLERVAAPPPKPEISEEEWEQRKAREKRAIAEWAAQHPECVPKTPTLERAQVVDLARVEFAEIGAPQTSVFGAAQ